MKKKKRKAPLEITRNYLNPLPSMEGGNQTLLLKELTKLSDATSVIETRGCDMIVFSILKVTDNFIRCVRIVGDETYPDAVLGRKQMIRDIPVKWFYDWGLNKKNLDEIRRLEYFFIIRPEDSESEDDTAEGNLFILPTERLRNDILRVCQCGKMPVLHDWVHDLYLAEVMADETDNITFVCRGKGRAVRGIAAIEKRKDLRQQGDAIRAVIGMIEKEITAVITYYSIAEDRTVVRAVLPSLNIRRKVDDVTYSIMPAVKIILSDIADIPDTIEPVLSINGRFCRFDKPYRLDKDAEKTVNNKIVRSFEKFTNYIESLNYTDRVLNKKDEILKIANEIHLKDLGKFAYNDYVSYVSSSTQKGHEMCSEFEIVMEVLQIPSKLSSIMSRNGKSIKTYLNDKIEELTGTFLRKVC